MANQAALDSLSVAISAAVSAVAAKVVIYPLDFFKLRLSVKTANETVSSILKQTLERHGIFGIYMGLGPRLVRTGIQKLNYFYFYELLLQIYARLFPARPIGVAMNLVVGVLGDWCCVPVVVPLEMMSMQQSEGKSLLGVLRETYTNKGLSGFYMGWTGYIFGSIMPAIQ